MSNPQVSAPAPAVEEPALATTGRIVAVAYSPEMINGVAKEPHDSAHVTRWGIPGDRHYGETRVSRGAVVSNNRPITVVAVEGTRAACEALGIDPIPPGGLGENFLTEGVGDLSDLVSGDQIHIGPKRGDVEVVLEVFKQNTPCSNTQIYHKQMVKHLYGRRGVLCSVLKEGHAHVGDSVWLVRDGEELYRG